MDRKHITAVVPVYNVQDYLEECLDSICNQTEQFDEVILVNDGSTDESRRICEKYCEKYDYISLINQENAGLSEARNTGLKAAKGQYVIFIDSDDAIEANTVQLLRREVIRACYDVVFFSASVKCDSGIGESAAFYTRDNALCGIDMSGGEFFLKAFPSNYIVSACLALYRKNFLKENKIYFEKGIYFEDNDFHFRVCMMARKIKCMNDTFYIRRYRADSIMSGAVSYKKCVDLITVNQLLWKALERAEIDNKYKIKFISNYLIHTWDVIGESEYLQDVQEQWKRLSNSFHNKWLDLYLKNPIGFNDRLALYLMLNETNSTDRSTLRTKIEAELIDKLQALPLSKSDKRIGIYGIGKHTEELFELYRRYMGEINPNMVFIITANSKGEKLFKGCPLITCEEISKDIDNIIISSLKYQKEMSETLKKNGIDEDRVIKLYRNDEYCDYASVMRILR